MQRGQLLAYHDRSDGGLLVTLLEMAFAGHCGLEIDLAGVPGEALAKLFNEEAGAVLQLPKSTWQASGARAALGLDDCLHVIGRRRWATHCICDGEKVLLHDSRRACSSCGRAPVMKSRPARQSRVCPRGVRAHYRDDPGLSAQLSFDPAEDISAPYIATGVRPTVAILREQGVNGQWKWRRPFTAPALPPLMCI